MVIHLIERKRLMNRRNFILQSVSGMAALGMAGAVCDGQTTQPATQPVREVVGRRQLDPKLVNDFVAAGHGDLAKVKQMLADEPPAQKRLGGLILAQRELILGDLETALGGASHMGEREIALYLLSQGARIDAFAAAMLGYRDVVGALVKACPETATTKGPHAYTLLYHAALSGNTDIAADIKPHLPAGRPDCNQALIGASGKGHLDMVRWLLANGVTDLTTKDGIGNTALSLATRNRFSEIETELRKAGAK
jgi:ankyrin repeat protein